MWSRFPREWSCSSLDPLGVLALLPDDLPLDEVGVGRAFHSVNGEFGGGAHTAGRTASREADVAEAGGAAARRRGEGVCGQRNMSMLNTNETVCEVCHRPIGESVFVWKSDGTVMHAACAKKQS